ncbi:MAG: DUF4445 domain-containing protein [Thermoplasmata archaeon]|nr:MAG: DUF4445 domain-containing protein [Thermoplasmata archaeon]
MVETINIKFLPDNISKTIETGLTIFEAASEAGIYLNSICGGHGTCGSCKVQVKNRKFPHQDTLKFISAEEAEQGFCLACQVTLDSDAEIFIPPKTRAKKPQILTKTHELQLTEIDSPTQKIHMALEPPTLNDNLSDLERIIRELKLRDEFKGKHFESSLIVLRKISNVLQSSNWDVTVSLCSPLGYTDLVEIIDIEAGNTQDRHLGIAVDIGTTTIVVELVDLTNGNIIAVKSDYNHQVTYGEDVLSRIFYAEEHGVDNLTKLVLETINNLIKELLQDKDVRKLYPEISREYIQCATFAGNTVMTHLFLGLNPINIKKEPYIPTLNKVPVMRADKLNLDISESGHIYCLPNRSSYVGGDITADILVSGMHQSPELSMLIDVGTNGEIVLGNKDWMMACSCSAGPSFEGGEVKCGMRASSGAIEKIRINDDLEPSYSTIGNTKARGICGSGLIDLIAELIVVNAITRGGRFNSANSTRIREGDEGTEYVIEWAENAAQSEDIVITETDIKNVIRTKSAVYAAASVLLKSVNHKFSDLDTIYIAGGFGNFIDAKKAILIGLLPDVPHEKFDFIGNGSLAGARLALISDKHRKEAIEIYNKLTYLELSVDNKFFNEFTSAMFLPHTDISKFPTIKDIFSNNK